MATLTTANSALAIAVRGLFPVPQNIEGYATDDSFSVEDVNPVEVMIGVDGKLSAGFTPYLTVMTIMLQADSVSVAMFDSMLAAQAANKELFYMDGVLIVQGTGKKYAMTKGVLSTATPAETGKKVLQPRKYTITWESMTKAPG